MHLNLTVTGEVIKEKWRDFARLAGIPSEDWRSLSSGWLDSYKMRHQIKSYRKHGEGASVDLVVLEEEVERIKKITSKFKLKNIFNMDETGLFFFTFLLLALGCLPTLDSHSPGPMRSRETRTGSPLLSPAMLTEAR
ncbi:hypothetical protein PSTG_14967 [Puccinia striiformis f. sp. tritici PST-78]|uniref:HTH CENPB-type domain-containing protein n=1 Tax=Puccinia striiformis f. sp. tritici PST-78 TaxID=1165861 RepID=A0A0L0UX62_9BASI|nr:hypothetical protein PSTG_14967 [Puccinia striiformis f. sp. tritici PST-78]